MRSLLSGLICLFLVIPAVGQNTAYAFTNKKGNALLTLDPESGALRPEDALRYGQAICAGGQLFDIQYVSQHSSDSRDTGRATAANFEHYRGYEFRIERGRTEPDADCLVAPRSFFEDKQLLPLSVWRGRLAQSGQPSACDPQTLKSLPPLEDRAVVHCAQLAQVGTDAHLLALEYEPRGASLLGALALKLPDRLIVREYPAERSESSWRVDDEGKWDAGSFIPIFALRRAGGEFEFGVVWSGPEGGSLLLLRSEGSRLVETKVGYRYWQPM